MAGLTAIGNTSIGGSSVTTDEEETEIVEEMLTGGVGAGVGTIGVGSLGVLGKDRFTGVTKELNLQIGYEQLLLNISFQEKLDASLVTKMFTDLDKVGV